MTRSRNESPASARHANRRGARSPLLHDAPDGRQGRKDRPPPGAGFGLRLAQLLLGSAVSLSAGTMAGALLWFVTAPQVAPSLPGASVPILAAADAPLITAAAPDDGGASEAGVVSLAAASPVLVAQTPRPRTETAAAPVEAGAGSLGEPAQPKSAPTIEPVARQAIQSQALPYTEDLPPVQLRRSSRRRNGAALDAALASLDLAALAPSVASFSGPPPWRRYAVPSAATQAQPMIAMVIDDLGLNRTNTWRTISLPGPLTLALMTYGDNLQSLADAARSAGHETLVHVPMAPRDAALNPGPNVLREDLGPVALGHRLDWALSRFHGFVGINNHMGSRFTASVPGMAQVMMQLKARGLLYLDSVTAAESVGGALAERFGVPYAERDVFIDNEPEDRAAIRRQLQELERDAQRTGLAIGIGHPHDLTIEELARWIPDVQARGFKLVPITAVVRAPG